MFRKNKDQITDQMILFHFSQYSSQHFFPGPLEICVNNLLGIMKIYIVP